MNRRARFLARVEQEAQDEASVQDEAPAPNAAVGRRGRRRSQRARHAAEIEPEVPQANFDMQAFVTSMQDNNAAIRDSMIMMQQMMAQQQQRAVQQPTQVPEQDEVSRMAVNYARLTPPLEFDGTKPQETLDFLDQAEMRGRVLERPELQLVGLVEMSMREVVKD